MSAKITKDVLDNWRVHFFFMTQSEEYDLKDLSRRDVGLLELNELVGEKRPVRKNNFDSYFYEESVDR